MTLHDVTRIFGDNCYGDVLKIGNGQFISIEVFLEIFKEAPDNPTKDDLHIIDGGVKGYAEFIENGNYEA